MPIIDFSYPETPDEEVPYLLDGTQCSCCAACRYCDYIAPTIRVEASGSYNYEAQFWAGAVGVPIGEYYDWETRTVDWAIDYTFTQVPKEDPLARGEYHFHNNMWLDTNGQAPDFVAPTTPVCRPTYQGRTGWFSPNDFLGGVTHEYSAYDEATQDTLIVDRDDPSDIIHDTSTTQEVGFRFGDPGFNHRYHKAAGQVHSYRWWVYGMIVGPHHLGQTSQGPYHSPTPSAGTFAINCGTGSPEGGHPRGIYTAVVEDSFQGIGSACDDYVPSGRKDTDRIAYGATGVPEDTWVNLQHSMDITITVTGSGLTNCDTAPEGVPTNT